MLGDVEVRSEDKRIRIYTCSMILLFSLVSLCFEFWGHAWITGHPGYWVFGDLQSLTSESVGIWNGGGIGQIYSGSSQILIAFPGFLYFLSALSWLTHLLGMSSPGFNYYLHAPYSGYYLAGSSWFVILPIVTTIGFLPALAIDRLCELTGASASRRYAVTPLALIVLAWVSVWWGHPDDAIAVGFLMWATCTVLEGKTRKAGWLIGLGIICQPLIVLAIPILLAIVPAKRFIGFLIRIATPAAAALLLPLVGDPHDTIRQVIVQPAMTDYKTPLLGLAPHVSAGQFAVPGAYMVSGGIVRSLSAVAAIALGVWLWRWTRSANSISPSLVVWLVGVSLSFRIVVEPVLLPYYLAPILLVLIVTISHLSLARECCAVACGFLAAVVISLKLPVWPYWISVLLSLGMLLLATYPSGADKFMSVRSGGASSEDEKRLSYNNLNTGLISRQMRKNLGIEWQ